MEKNYAVRHARAAKTKEMLTEAAMRLINERGYANVSVDDICAECGISKGAFYHHFKTKMDIVSLLEQQVTSQTDESVASRTDIDVCMKLYLLLLEFIKGVAGSGLELVRQRTVYNISGEYTKRAEAGSYSVESRSMARKILIMAIESGELDKTAPVENVVETISTFMSGLISSWTMFNGEFSIIQRAEDLGYELIKGLLSKYLK